MKALKQWQLVNVEHNTITLDVDGQHSVLIYILEQDLFRVLVKKIDNWLWIVVGQLRQKAVWRHYAIVPK